MEFLKEYGFEKEDISELVDNTPNISLKLLWSIKNMSG